MSQVLTVLQELGEVMDGAKLVEAAPGEMEGLVLDGWALRDGKLIVPDTPGAGVDVEPDTYEKGMQESGGFCAGR